MLTRVIAIDEDSGVFYGELRPRKDDLDLVGFLARAWSRKIKHPLRGFPAVLYAPSRVLGDTRLAKDVAWCADLGGVSVLPAPGGFGPATVAAREYERELLSAGAGGKNFVLGAALSAAQEISFVACFNGVSAFGKSWEPVAGLPAAAIAAFDAMYETPGAWRMDEFARFIVADGS